MREFGKKVVGGLMAVALAGCYEGVDGVGGADERGLVVQGLALQGIQLQGIFLQGIRLQGIQLQGLRLQGIRLQGIFLQGIKLQGLKLQGSQIAAVQEINGELVDRSGADLIGTEFHIDVETEDDEGEEIDVGVTIRLDDFYLSPDAEIEDMYAYEVSYKADGSDTWGSLCEDADGVGWPAYVFEGYWDEDTGDFIDEPDTISFACHYGVVAKCALWGYRPWAEAEDCKKKNKKGEWKKCEMVSLRDHHQACTRMARADYCGDGVPWTVNGTQIDIWDDLGPQIQEREAKWDIEGEWTPEGAWCLNDIRQQGWKEEGLYPSCGKKTDKQWKRRANRCGKLKNKSSLFVSSFNGDA